MDPLPTGDSDAPNTGSPAFHGYAPKEGGAPVGFRPPLTIAISRETGARGKAIAERTARLLDWNLISQETLEYMSGNDSLTAGVEHALSPEAAQWVEMRMTAMRDAGMFEDNEEIVPLARLIHEVAAQGQCVILGRGAGALLPADAKMYVRLIAPEKDRVAYISQRERLSWSEAEQYVRDRDEARLRFVTTKFRRSLSDLLQFDLVINVSQFGVEASATLIVAAAREKEARLGRQWDHESPGELDHG